MESRTLLEAVVVDRSDSVPLHRQLYLELRRLIGQKKLKPGAALPQVNDLCRTLGISTITATRAIGELKREGLVVTRRGVGIFIAERPSPVTEVVVGLAGFANASPGSFLYPLVEGIKKELGEPRRRCILTYYDEQPPSVQEIRDLMRSRQADSLIAFRPTPNVIQAAQLLSRDYPAVIVFDRPPGWKGDSVLPAPQNALRLLLKKRLAASCRRFLYLGKQELQANSEEASPYRCLAAIFKEVMSGARAESDMAILGKASNTSADVELERRLAERARELPDGTVVVADTPNVAAEVFAVNPRLDLISYTEADYSVERFKDRMTLLYCGLDRAGAAAAKLLRARLASPKLAPKTIQMGAVVVGG